MAERDAARRVFTIGHSNHPIDHFMGLLARHEIQMVLDVRSDPHSRFYPWFGKRRLKMRLIRAGIVYCFLGDSLGGRPRDEAFQSAIGGIDWLAYAASARFQEGIQWILDQARNDRLCLMCGEADPGGCHRQTIIAQALLERGVTVHHILADGRLEPASPDLFHYACLDLPRP